MLQFVQAMRGQGMEAVRIAYVEKHAEQIPDVEFAGLLANENGFDARVFRMKTPPSAGCATASAERPGAQDPRP